MPIVVTNKTFTDNFANQLTFYRGNAGDRFNFSVEVETNIRVSSVGNPILFDITTNQLTSTAVSWLDEGIRLGDSVTVSKYTSGGLLLITWNATVNTVTDTILDLSTLQTSSYSLANGEILVIEVTNRNRDDLDILLNHVQNGQIGSAVSLIDGEVTRAVFTGVDALIVTGNINGNLVGNQSGQFIISASIIRLADPVANTKKYDISIDFVNSGAYDSAWFNSANCLKVYLKLLWASIGGEPFDRTELIITDDADTGYFEQAFNTGVINTELLQGVDELDYCTPSTFDIVIDGDDTDLGIGSLYISLDENYYKNRPYRQNEITMLIPSFSTGLGFAISDQNEFNAGYTITINSVTPVGSVTTVNITFTPNAAFNTFFEGRDEGDRLFYLWIKAGNQNLLAFEDQLTCEPPVGGPLIMASDYAYLDHSQNVTSIAGSKAGFIADTEDDVAYLGTFLLDKEQIYQTFSVLVEVFNTVTGDDFTLQSVQFNFNGVQISNDGRYLLNESQTIITTLPGTSAKLSALLELDPALDTPTQYGVKIYSPFLCRWEKWLEQNNANVDFYPTQNKDWEQYDNLANWQIQTQLILVKENLSFTHENIIIIEPYDNEELIISSIELERLVPVQIVDVIPDGETLIVRATHVKSSGAWLQAETWGQITVEPEQAAPRSICSSVVDYDNNTSNPLTPIASPLIIIDFPAPDTAVMECYFDSNKIDLTNGVEFTSKIKENDKPIPAGAKTTAPLDEPKTKTDSTIKTEAP